MEPWGLFEYSLYVTHLYSACMLACTYICMQVCSNEYMYVRNYNIHIPESGGALGAFKDELYGRARGAYNVAFYLR